MEFWRYAYKLDARGGFLISCNLFLPRAAQALAAEAGLPHSRSFMGFAAPFTNKRKAYSERRIMG